MVATFGRITVDLHPFQYFPDDAQVARDHKIINEEFGPYFPLEFTVKTESINGIKNPEIIKRMLEFQAEVEKEALVDNSMSVAKIVKKVHQTFAPEAPPLPDSEMMVAQELLLYEMGDPRGLNPYINQDADQGQIIFKIKFTAGKETQDLLNRILAVGEKQFEDSPPFKPQATCQFI